jgi:hypothetical protein
MHDLVNIIEKHNPFDPTEMEVSKVKAGSEFIHWLLERYPKGFTKPTKVYLNQKEIDVIDYDFIINKDDVVIVTYDVGDPITLTIAIVAAAAVSYVVVQNLIPSVDVPEEPSSLKTGQQKQNTAYGLRAQRNFARLGEPIPSRYGRFRVYPDLAARPYLRYSRVLIDNGSTVFQEGTGNDEELYQVFCLGHGEYSISDFRLIDTSVENIRGFEYETYLPGTPVTFFDDNIYTLPIGNNIEIKQKGRYWREYATGSNINLSLTGVTDIVRFDWSGTTSQNFNEFIAVGDIICYNLLNITISTTTIPLIDSLAQFIDNRYGEVTDVSENFIEIKYPLNGVAYNSTSVTGASVLFKKEYINEITPGSLYTYPFGYLSLTIPFRGKPDRFRNNYLSSERYVLSPVNTFPEYVEIDFEFRRGLYNFVDPDYTIETASFVAIFTEIDDKNKPVYSYQQNAPGTFLPVAYIDYSVLEGEPLKYIYHWARYAYQLPVSFELEENEPTFIYDQEVNLGTESELLTYRWDWVEGFRYLPNKTNTDPPTKVNQSYPDFVIFNNVGYICLVDHTSSSSFANDLAAGYWEAEDTYFGFNFRIPNRGSSLGGLYMEAQRSVTGTPTDPPKLIDTPNTYYKKYESDIRRFDISASSPDVTRVSYRIELSGTKRYDIVIQRDPVDFYDWNDDNRVDECVITRIKSKLPNVENYGPFSMVAMKLTATEDINANNSDRFNMLLERKLPIWDGTNWSAPTVTRSITWAIADLWMATYGGSNPYTTIDLDKFIELDNFWSARGDTFDGFFDQKLGLMEAIQKVARVGRAKPVILNNGKLSLVRDEELTTATAFFGPQNMLKDSFSIEYEISDNSSYDGIRLKYLDEDDNYAPAYVVSEDVTSSKLKEIDFFGCVNYEQAWRECQYLTAVFQLQRQKIEFSTEFDGYIPLVGDLISVSQDLADWASSGYVENKNNLEITTSEPLDFSGGGTYYIEFRRRNGSVSGPYVVTQGSDEYTAILQSDVTDMTFYTTVSSIERTYYAFGGANNFTKKSIVTEIIPKGVDKTTVKCIPYIDAIYTADEGTIPPKPTNEPSPNPIPPKLGGLTVVNTATSGDITAVWNPQYNIDNYVIEYSNDNIIWNSLGNPTINTFTGTTGTGNKYIRVACVINTIPGDYEVTSIIVV